LSSSVGTIILGKAPRRGKPCVHRVHFCLQTGLDAQEMHALAERASQLNEDAGNRSFFDITFVFDETEDQYAGRFFVLILSSQLPVNYEAIVTIVESYFASPYGPIQVDGLIRGQTDIKLAPGELSQ
jgi:hypothetical protein